MIKKSRINNFINSKQIGVLFLRDDGDGDENTKTYVLCMGSGDVTVTAYPNPVLAEADLPSCWSLSGGNGSGKLTRTVDKSVAEETTISAIAGTSYKTTKIVIIDLVSISPIGCDWFVQGSSLSKDQFDIVTDPVGFEDGVELVTTVVDSHDLSLPGGEDPGGQGTFDVIAQCGSDEVSTTVNVVDENASVSFAFLDIDGSKLSAYLDGATSLAGGDCAASVDGEFTVTRHPKLCDCVVANRDSVGGTISGGLTGCEITSPDILLGTTGFAIQFLVEFSLTANLTINVVQSCGSDANICAELGASGTVGAGGGLCLISCSSVMSVQVVGSTGLAPVGWTPREGCANRKRI